MNEYFSRLRIFIYKKLTELKLKPWSEENNTKNYDNNNEKNSQEFRCYVPLNMSADKFLKLTHYLRFCENGKSVKMKKVSY